MISAMHHAMTELVVMLALATPVAWAGSGTLEFHGAVVVPTCAVQSVDVTGLPVATPLAVVQPCPSKASTDAVAFFTETRAPVSEAVGDLLLDYFVRASKPTGGNVNNDLLVRVYL